ncbi:MAG: ribbon-helix-helix protein, CopG family, partial [Ilumatobacteraceae bacterium]
MTSKPAPIRWLEQQTGQEIDYTSSPAVRDRHLSVRLTGEMAASVDALAVRRGVAVSQFVRELLEAEVARARSLAELD